LIAALIGKFITNSLASKVLRYSAIALFIAMGLRYMGLADSIINLAFGAVVIGGAAAAALAFGLGGRDAAARMLGKVDLDEAAGAANTGGDGPGATGGGVGASGASNSGPGATGGPATPGTHRWAASAGYPQYSRTEPLRDRHLRPGVPRGGGVGKISTPPPSCRPPLTGIGRLGPKRGRAVKLRLWSMHRGDSADFADPPRRIDHKPRMRGAGLSSGCHASDAVASDRDRDDGDADDQEDDRRGGFDEEVGAAVGHRGGRQARRQRQDDLIGQQHSEDDGDEQSVVDAGRRRRDQRRQDGQEEQSDLRVAQGREDPAAVGHDRSQVAPRVRLHGRGDLTDRSC